MKIKKHGFTNKIISIVSLSAFMLVIIILFSSYIYMNTLVSNEAAAQKNRYELGKLGQSLASASDYLTDEVRKYAITGKIEHLYNYWNEVENNKRRDNAIMELISLNPPKEEIRLLQEAKQFSDELIGTESQSMKMILLYQNKSEQDFKHLKKNKEDTVLYVKKVLEYPLSNDYLSLNKNEMKNMAIEMLFDNNYIETKEKIMNPIDSFLKLMNERLDIKVINAEKGRRNAVILQIICAVFAITIIGIVLFIYHFFYILPLKEYTRQLKKNGILKKASNEDNEVILSRLRIDVKGAFELREFARIFNGLSCLLLKEVEKSKTNSENMRIAKDEAVKANRAKSDFLATMSHELRTPLNAITGYTHLLGLKELDEKQTKYCKAIDYSAQSLLGLINDILDYSKIEKNNVDFESITFSLKELLEEIYSVMNNSAVKKNISLTIDNKSSCDTLIGDPSKLKQILINLIGNAIKFTNKGEVILSVKEISNKDNINTLYFSVKDTGIGIKKEDLEKIFKPFTQSDASITRLYGGTGLGLSISRNLIELYSNKKYTLSVDSVLDKGSDFYFYLDFKIGKQKDIFKYKGDNKLKNLNKSKVLLVDDNEINLMVEKEILENYQLQVAAVNSGEKAIEFIKANLVDLILMDMRMPNMDGCQCSMEIRKINKAVPIVALTADVNGNVKTRVLQSGMQEYLTKPVNQNKLIWVLNRYLGMDNKESMPVKNNTYEYFNEKECLINLNGNKALLDKLIKHFLATQKDSIIYAKKHYDNNNISNTLSILHDLKGVCGNLSMEILLQEIIFCENEIRQGNDYDFTKLFAIWDSTINEIQKYEIKKEQKHISQENQQDVINKFIKLCEENDIMAVELFENNCEVFKKSYRKDIYEGIYNNIMRYDFENVLNIING